MKLFISLLFTVLTLSVNSHGDENSKKTAFTQVNPKHVCMVNDKYFGIDQIPIKVKERTYYGCCENCKKALKETEKPRFAIDPVSKNKVDKSSAIIGAFSDRKVHYFENLDNFKKYKIQLTKKH